MLDLFFRVTVSSVMKCYEGIIPLLTVLTIEEHNRALYLEAIQLSLFCASKIHIPFKYKTSGLIL